MKSYNAYFSFSFLLFLISICLLFFHSLGVVTTMAEESGRELDDIDDEVSMDMSVEPTPVPTESITIDRSTVPARIEKAFSYCGASLDLEARKALRNSMRQVMAKFSAEGTCKTNICFAMDGSSRVTKWKFGLQKLFVSLVASLLSTGNSESFYSGVQYSAFTTPIEPPTTNIKQFLETLDNVKQANMTGRNIAAGLGYCGFQLFNKPTGVLLILGSGEPTEGLGFDPAFVADRIRPPKGPSPIFAVSSSGFKQDFDEVVGSNYPDNILTVRNCRDLGDAAVKFISLIC